MTIDQREAETLIRRPKRKWKAFDPDRCPRPDCDGTLRYVPGDVQRDSDWGFNGRRFSYSYPGVEKAICRSCGRAP